MTVEPDNFEVEHEIREPGEIEVVAAKIAAVVDKTLDLLRSEGSIYRCSAEYTPATGKWMVRFEIAPGDRKLTASDFATEILRMLRAHL